MATLYVAVGNGSDLTGAGTTASPFKSIQHAVNVSTAGDNILVAGGTYTYAADQDLNGGAAQFGGVVILFDKSVSIQGGYNSANWGAGSNPAANPTVIDGQGVLRGVLETTSDPAHPGKSSLNLSNVTVQNGFATGSPAFPAGNDGQIFGFGGGLSADSSFLTVSNCLFKNNVAAGKTGVTYGGSAGGGGMSVRGMAGTVNISGLTFSGNQALGGSGTVRGGYGQGGGFFSATSTVNGSDLVFTQNYVSGGSTAGAGNLNGETADGLGGALELGFGPTGTLTRVVATGNIAIGGNALSGQAGGGFGGAIFTEQNALVLSDSRIQGNIAYGGQGGVVANNIGAGPTYGGGIHAFNSSLTLDRDYILANASLAGPGNALVPNGAPQGGGVAMSAFMNGMVGTFTNTVIAGNAAGQLGTGSNNLGGGGGGVSIQGPVATLTQCTIADNYINQPSMFGAGILVLTLPGGPANPTVNLNYSAITGNTGAGTGFLAPAAVHALQNTTVTEKRNLYFGNQDNDNSDGTPFNTGNFTFQSPPTVSGDPKYVAPGSPSFDYTPGAGSALIDAATGSNTTVDVTGASRQGTADIGATERIILPVQYGFAKASYNVNEEDGTVTVTVTRGGSTTGAFSVTVTSTNGTAIAGTDFVQVNANVQFAANATTATFTVTLKSTAARKGTISFGLQFSNPSDPSAVITGNSTTTISIRDAAASSPAVFDPSTATWYLRNSASAGAPASSFAYGVPGWTPVTGDWNGDGTTTIGVVDPNGVWYLRDFNNAGGAGYVFGYGGPGYIPLTGDWNGDGRTDVAVFNPFNAVWTLSGVGSFAYGAPGWIPITGDWNGDGKTDVGVVDPSTETFYLSGISPFKYGLPGWKVVAGDWDGNGTTDIGVFDPATATWYLGVANATPFAYGVGSWTPLGGNWNGLNGSPQRVDASAPVAASAPPLTQAALDATVAAALDRLQAAGLSAADLATVKAATFTVTDLPGLYLGLTTGTTVGIDATAAGRSWFVDPTPGDDDEFAPSLYGADLTAKPNGPAAGEVDLLTVVLHEMGWLLGADPANELMGVNLNVGTRRTNNLSAFVASLPN